MDRALFALADCCASVSGNIHTMHLNVIGGEFDTAHKVLEKYYEELDDDYDSAAEWGRAFGSFAPNKNESAIRIEFKSLEARPFSRDEAFAITQENLSQLLEQFSLVFRVADSNSDERDPRNIGVANWLQTRIEYWSKEVSFFNAARVGDVHEHI